MRRGYAAPLGARLSESGRERAPAALLARHSELPEVLVSHRYPLERMAEAYATANDKVSNSIKVVVEP